MDFKINPCLKNYHLDKDNVCDLCQKRILREEELSKMDLSCNSDEICVITTSDRVNTNYILHPLRVFGISVMIAFGNSLFSLNAHAQDTINQLQDSIIETKTVDFAHDLFSISGTVVDENHEPLPFVNIYIPIESGGYITGTTSDLDGKFTLKFDPHKVITNSFVVKVSSVEFSPQEIEFSKTEIMNKIAEGKFEMEISYVVLELHLEMLGFYFIDEPKLNKDSDAHRSTKFGRDELRRSPYRN